MANQLHPIGELPEWRGQSPATPKSRHWLREKFDSEELDLRAIWMTLWQRKWSIISLVIVAMMLATLYVNTLTPMYQATSSLLIEQRSPEVVSIEQVYGVEGTGQEHLMTQVQLLRSRGLAERVVRRLDLHLHPEFDPAQQEPPRFDVRAEARRLLASIDPRNLIPGPLPEDLPEEVETTPPPVTEEQRIARTAGALRERIGVEPVRGSHVLLLRVTMADRTAAADAANALAEAYIESHLDARMEITLSATGWMSGRLGELRDSLREAESRLQAFRDEHDLVDVSGILTVSANELASNSDRMINARRERAEAESLYRQVRDIETEGWESVVSVPAVLSNSLVQQFRSDEARAQAHIDELSSRYGPRHPNMESAQSDLTSARANLRSQVEQVVASIERNYQLALANERALTQAVETNREQLQDLGRREFELGDLQREVDTNRALYDTFLTRLQETTATMDMETVNARIVDRATVPGSPISPNKNRTILLSGILAGMFGSGLALLLMALNNTFRGSEDVEEQLNLPVLGIVPQLKGPTRAQILRTFNDPKQKAFAEAVRTIRTGVFLSGIDRPHKILLVTSSLPGEGKTTVAANLAFALSQMNNAVLVESDMRRPTLAKAFDMPVGTPGLANLIMGTASLEDAVQQTDGLNVITAGLVPPNPLELLSTDRFTQVLSSIGERFDLVVLDSPPLQAVSDALLLGTLADAVIYVIRADHTSRSHAVKGVGRLLQAGAPLSGTVLNQVNVKKAQKYGYSYGGYYDYYGYSSGGGSRGGKGSAA